MRHVKSLEILSRKSAKLNVHTVEYSLLNLHKSSPWNYADFDSYKTNEHINKPIYQPPATGRTNVQSAADKKDV